MEGEEKSVNYRLKMQTGDGRIDFAILPGYVNLPVDINVAHKYCEEYNAISRKADPKSIQGQTRYWIEEML